ncbi:MAG: leader peptide processing enzyme [Treponema sp.]|jgi:hypothetical protein|nr:leader peptide processing enzyme [Treponema sp.]
MRSKFKLALIMLAATAFNILVTALCLVILLVLYGLLLSPHIPAEKAFIGLPILFVIALVLSFVIYQLTLKTILKKRGLRKTGGDHTPLSNQ